MNPFATPISAIGRSSSTTGVSGDITWLSQSSETGKQSRPKPAMYRGCARSVSFPTYGARAPDTTAIGTSSSADRVGLNPRTACAYSISGNAIAVTPNPTVVIARLASEKFRSRNSASGSSGSEGLRACQTMNTAITTSPAMISDQTVTGPRIVPQS